MFVYDIAILHSQLFSITGKQVKRRTYDLLLTGVPQADKAVVPVSVAAQAVLAEQLPAAVAEGDQGAAVEAAHARSDGAGRRQLV